MKSKSNYVIKNLNYQIMKIVPSDPEISRGSCFQGYLKTTYWELVCVFGEPLKADDKSDVCWNIDVISNHGKFLCYIDIYNYKNGKNYLGEDGKDVEDIVLWNIGGETKIVIEYVRMWLEDHGAKFTIHDTYPY